MTAPMFDQPESRDPWEPFFSRVEQSSRVPRPVKAYLGFLARSRSKILDHSARVLDALDGLEARAAAANERQGSLGEILAPLHRQQPLTSEQLTDEMVAERFHEIGTQIIASEERDHPFTESPFHFGDPFGE